MTCGGPGGQPHEDHCNKSYSDIHYGINGEGEYHDTICYSFGDENDCGQGYYVDNSGNYQDVFGVNYDNYGDWDNHSHIPHTHAWANTPWGQHGDTLWNNYPFSQTPHTNYPAWNDFYNHIDYCGGFGDFKNTGWGHGDTPTWDNYPWGQSHQADGHEESAWSNHTTNEFSDYENSQNWDNYGNTPFTNFCNHTDSYHN